MSYGHLKIFIWSVDRKTEHTCFQRVCKKSQEQIKLGSSHRLNLTLSSLCWEEIAGLFYTTKVHQLMSTAAREYGSVYVRTSNPWFSHFLNALLLQTHQVPPS